MKKVIRTKLIHEGEYIAKIPVKLTETDDQWSPYLSLLRLTIRRPGAQKEIVLQVV